MILLPATGNPFPKVEGYEFKGSIASESLGFEANYRLVATDHQYDPSYWVEAITFFGCHYPAHLIFYDDSVTIEYSRRHPEKQPNRRVMGNIDYSPPGERNMMSVSVKSHFYGFPFMKGEKNATIISGYGVSINKHIDFVPLSLLNGSIWASWGRLNKKESVVKSFNAFVSLKQFSTDHPFVQYMLRDEHPLETNIPIEVLDAYYSWRPE